MNIIICIVYFLFRSASVVLLVNYVCTAVLKPVSVMGGAVIEGVCIL